MSHTSILSDDSTIHNFISKLHLPLYFSQPVNRHITDFIAGAIQKGYRGKVNDLVELSFASCHRTTFGHFLSKGNWDESYLWKTMKNKVLQTIKQTARETRTPTFAIYDDTIAKKTKPSSQAIHPIEAADFHFSHLECKTVWGHQLLCAMLSTGTLTLPYHIEHYEKGSTSKIDKVCQIADSLPRATGPAYGLFDSWFTCKKVIEAHFKKGYHIIGGLKTNRIIYPQGIRTSIRNFAACIAKNDVRLVTVNSQSYWVYRYEGSLNEIDNAVVLFCWPEDAFLNPKAMRTFLCTDMELDTRTALEYYSKRWPIETFFRQTKGNLGLNRYQIRGITAIKRFWALTTLTYLFCTIGAQKITSLAVGLSFMRRKVKTNLISWIYNQAQAGVSLSQVLLRLKSA
jgi:hypothetical protein